MLNKIRVGLYGKNGHQIQHLLADHPLAELAAVAPADPEMAGWAADQVRIYDTLEQMLQDDGVDLVSLCSPRRSDQAADAIRCLEAGKHVYAEKPCALTEGDLDEILRTVERTGKQFREMNGTADAQPYEAMGRIVRSGQIGEVVQVFAQKSYPYRSTRPQDEEIDGGLTMQAGVHALRMIEFAAGSRIKEIQAFETKRGNPSDSGDLRMASSLMMTLESGAVASAVVNYLNPLGFGKWGNEHLRVFGTLGFVESTDGGTRTRLVVGDRDLGPIDVSGPVREHFDRYAEALLGITTMPKLLRDELHPTRMIIRAKLGAGSAP